MVWPVELHPAFERELNDLDEDVRRELAAKVERLRRDGPRLARPHADQLAGSRHANMKELRFTAANGQWRAAFAFDPERKAIVLVAGDKAGRDQRRFYRNLISIADRRFDEHLLGRSG
jgi:hypothetical protein